MNFETCARELQQKVRNHAEKRSRVPRLWSTRALGSYHAPRFRMPRLWFTRVSGWYHATRSSVIVDSCERAALSVSILLGSLKTFPAKLFEKLQSFASNVCNELWSTKAHRASLSQEFAKESTIALESVARANSLTRGWQARHSRAFLSATRVVSPHFPNTGITEKQLRSKVLHQSPNVLYDSREGIEMGEHVPRTSPTMPSDRFLWLIKVTLPLEFIP